MNRSRTVFFVSDRTGITIDALGKTLLIQFPGVRFNKHHLLFIDTPEKARMALDEINRAASADRERPIVLSTLINRALRDIVRTAHALYLDVFEIFLERLQDELHEQPVYAVGLTHGIGSTKVYEQRMAAVNYTLTHDDGSTTANYTGADLILVGVSRCGKTPASLYLAMQYGLCVPNYPLTPDDFEALHLPKALAPHRQKLFGLTISPERLSAIRNERKPGSRYASVENCRDELQAAEKLFRQENIPVLDTSAMSVEEIAVTILHRTGLTSRF
jgi:hypothetical protein